MKILVVDDEPHILEVLSILFEREGYKVGTALNGKEAIEKVKSFSPDLILLDIMMPIMDGWEVCRKVKNSPSFSSIPVVILSVRAKPEDIQYGLKIGATSYITKPFSPPHLIKEISRIISEERY